MASSIIKVMTIKYKFFQDFFLLFFSGIKVYD